MKTLYNTLFNITDCLLDKLYYICSNPKDDLIDEVLKILQGKAQGTENGHAGDVPMPDISTREKAAAYCGIDMEEIVPQWIASAKESGKLYEY